MSVETMSYNAAITACETPGETDGGAPALRSTKGERNRRTRAGTVGPGF